MALQHYHAGRFSQAEAICEKVVRAQPKNADALHLLGVLAHQAGKNDLAVSLIGKAISINSRVAEFHNNLALAFQSLGRFDDAVAHYQRALALSPGLVEVHNNLGTVLKEDGKLEEAIACYNRALALQPAHPGVCNNLGNVFNELGRLEEAIGYFERALALRPDYAEAHNNLGTVFREQGSLEKAKTRYERALALKPDYAEAYYNLGNVLKEQGRTEECIAHFRHALALKPDYVEAHNNLLFRLNYLPEYDPAAIYAEHLRFAAQHEQPLVASIRSHLNERSPDRRLKIGYVSPDFRRHSVAHFIGPVLENHDRSQLEVFCYFCHHQADEMTHLLQAHADHWRNIARVSDVKAAEQIREDGIDILVDLAGHTGKNRLLVFARKPAPVQVTWLGYPNTTGLSAMDYRITDGFADPPGMTECFHTERLIRLSECFSCYRPPQACPEVGKLPALQRGYLTFGSFNNLAKINPQVMASWAKILHAVPRSRLVLKHNGPVDSALRGPLYAAFASLGIAAERLELRGADPVQMVHLQRYNDIDIGLDPFPYNGATTTCDALWMGVPVITLAGATHVARVGVSQMTNLGLTELIAHSPEEYVEIAVRLAGDMPRLRAMRASLRARMAASPLTDAPRFTRHLEQAYREMWRRWCATHQPS